MAATKGLLMATVRRRALITLRVDPARAAAVLPAGMEPITVDGHGLVSLCYSDIRGLRPVGMPSATGVSFQYLVTRMLVRVCPPGGEPFPSAHVLEALADSGFVRAGTRVVYRLPMRPADIELRDDDGTWHLSASAGGEAVTDCTLRACDTGEALRGSVFGTFDEALVYFQSCPYISTYLWFDRKLTDLQFWARSYSPDDFNCDFYDLSNINVGWSDRPSLITANCIYSHRAEGMTDEEIVEESLRAPGPDGADEPRGQADARLAAAPARARLMVFVDVVVGAALGQVTALGAREALEHQHGDQRGGLPDLLAAASKRGTPVTPRASAPRSFVVPLPRPARARARLRGP